jgi:hypothetical protein
MGSIMPMAYANYDYVARIGTHLRVSYSFAFWRQRYNKKEP